MHGIQHNSIQLIRNFGDPFIDQKGNTNHTIMHVFLKVLLPNCLESDLEGGVKLLHTLRCTSKAFCANGDLKTLSKTHTEALLILSGWIHMLLKNYSAPQLQLPSFLMEFEYQDCYGPIRDIFERITLEGVLRIIIRPRGWTPNQEHTPIVTIIDEEGKILSNQEYSCFTNLKTDENNTVRGSPLHEYMGWTPDKNNIVYRLISLGDSDNLLNSEYIDFTPYKHNILRPLTFAEQAWTTDKNNIVYLLRPSDFVEKVLSQKKLTHKQNYALWASCLKESRFVQPLLTYLSSQELELPIRDLLVLDLADRLKLKKDDADFFAEHIEILYAIERTTSCFLPKGMQPPSDIRRVGMHIHSILALSNKDFCPLTQLTQLKINNYLLTQLPDAIGNLINLTHLIVTDNKNLHKLPKSITNLKNLEILNVSRNQLRYLPDAIAELKALEELNVSDNNLKSLPCIVTLANLVNLAILDNPFKEKFSRTMKKFMRSLEYCDWTAENYSPKIYAFKKLYKSQKIAEQTVHYLKHLLIKVNFDIDSCNSLNNPLVVEEISNFILNEEDPFEITSKNLLENTCLLEKLNLQVGDSPITSGWIRAKTICRNWEVVLSQIPDSTDSDFAYLNEGDLIKSLASYLEKTNQDSSSLTGDLLEIPNLAKELNLPEEVEATFQRHLTLLRNDKERCLLIFWKVVADDLFQPFVSRLLEISLEEASANKNEKIEQACEILLKEGLEGLYRSIEEAFEFVVCEDETLDQALTRFLETHQEKIEDINLENLDISFLPKGIGKLSNLKNLNLFMHNLPCLPPEMKELCRLQKIELRSENSSLIESPGEINSIIPPECNLNA